MPSKAKQTASSTATSSPAALSSESDGDRQLRIPVSDLFVPQWKGEISYGACRDFLCDVEKYRSRGGVTPLLNLIHEDTLFDLQLEFKTLELGALPAENETEEQLIARLLRAFVHTNPKQALDALQGLAMKPNPNFDMQPLRDYNRKFSRLCADLGTNTISIRKQIKMYIRGLQPKMLRDEMDVEDDTCEDLESMCVKALYTYKE